MLYTTFRRKLKTCPFCKPEQETISSNKGAYLTYALAPYHPFHLLVIPKRHVVSFLNLQKNELKDIDKLVRVGMAKLHKLKFKNITVLVRDGSMRGANKSVEHLHYHLIPNTSIGDINHAGLPRQILDTKQIEKLLKKLK